MEKEKLTMRLRRIKGQIEGIERMIEAERECEDILIQVKASQKALLKFGESMIQCNLDDCLKNKISKSDMKRQIEGMVRGFINM